MMQALCWQISTPFREIVNLFKIVVIDQKVGVCAKSKSIRLASTGIANERNLKIVSEWETSISKDDHEYEDRFTYYVLLEWH
jgi:hypothetical protein